MYTRDIECYQHKKLSFHINTFYACSNACSRYCKSTRALLTRAVLWLDGTTERAEGVGIECLSHLTYRVQHDFDCIDYLFTSTRAL